MLGKKKRRKNEVGSDKMTAREELNSMIMIIIIKHELSLWIRCFYVHTMTPDLFYY